MNNMVHPFAHRKHNQMCHLLVSDAGGPEGPWSLYIYERWCPLILTIQGNVWMALLRPQVRFVLLQYTSECADSGSTGNVTAYFLLKNAWCWYSTGLDGQGRLP